MGFSVSGSAAIIFAGFIVAAGLAVPSLAGSFTDVTDSQGEQIDRGVATINTELEIENATYNETSDTLTVEARNTGSTELSASDTSLLVDGVLLPDADRTVVGVTESTDLWLVGDLLRFTVTDVSGRDDIDETELNRAKVVAENGIDDVVLDVERVT